MKKAIRKAFLEKRNALSKETVSEWSAAIEENILQLVKEKNFQVIFAYASFRNEPDMFSLLKKLLAMGKTVALPKCKAKGKMTMYRVSDISDLQPGAYGILEPPEHTPVLPEQADLVLCPGCAFSVEMERMGYGGGYYDRYLPKCSKAVFAGVCYEICVTDALPTEESDVKMDCLITDKGLVNKV